MDDATGQLSPSDDAPAVRPVGRPRQYDDAEERELIMQAAYRTLRDRAGGEVTIAKVLKNAGVSTRSFYRHFPSKDALLCAMYRRDAESAGARIALAVEPARDPTEGLATWIGQVFDMVRNRRRAERVAVLGSIVGMRAEGIDAESVHARRVLIAPLVEVIEQGVRQGTMRSANPRATADLLAAVTMHAAGLGAVPSATTDHDEASVLAFALTALGAS